jgi:hypothetical protein
MILLDLVFYPKIISLTVDGGYKLAERYNSFYSQALMIAKSRGPVKFDFS